MKSKGFDILLDSEGKGIIGCMGVIVLFAAILFMGIKLGPIYYSNYTFEEDLKTVTSRAGARFTSNDTIIDEILNLAKENNINLSRKDAGKNIKIERYAGQVHINVQYFVPVDFIVIQKNLKFQVRLSSFTAG
jgi:hypothetical protein